VSGWKLYLGSKPVSRSAQPWFHATWQAMSLLVNVCQVISPALNHVDVYSYTCFTDDGKSCSSHDERDCPTNRSVNPSSLLQSSSSLSPFVCLVAVSTTTTLASVARTNAAISSMLRSARQGTVVYMCSGLHVQWFTCAVVYMCMTPSSQDLSCLSAQLWFRACPS
jgi:hypothetical protein